MSTWFAWWEEEDKPKAKPPAFTVKPPPEGRVDLEFETFEPLEEIQQALKDIPEDISEEVSALHSNIMSTWSAWWVQEDKPKAKPPAMIVKLPPQRRVDLEIETLEQFQETQQALKGIPEGLSEEASSSHSSGNLAGNSSGNASANSSAKSSANSSTKSLSKSTNSSVDGKTHQQAQEVTSIRSEDFSKREAYKVADENLDSKSEETATDTDYSGSGNIEDVATVDVDEEMDYEMVEQYDRAFNEFIGAHPEFVVISPDVVHSMRVCKLQKLLERGIFLETELASQREGLRESKERATRRYQMELLEASRKKAAREIHLASKLTITQKAFAAMEAKLTWKLVSACEANVKKQHRAREKLKNKLVGLGRDSLLSKLPDGPDFQRIRDAMMAPSSPKGKGPLSQGQKDDLQQFQIDNAFLHSEVALLQKKLAHVKADSQKNAWVESMLVRMDPKVLKKLKTKYEKKKGVAV